MRQEINKVLEDLDRIANRKEDFDLKRSEKEVVKKTVTGENSVDQTRSSIDEGISSRNKEKEEIIKILSASQDNEEHIGVLPVVGEPGLGKTKLAKEVFNDLEIRTIFPQRVWVVVSDVFDDAQILRAIHEQVTKKEVEGLPNIQELQKSLFKKRSLIVLDDVRNEDPAKWKSLKDVLKAGAMGSKVLVTTRSESVVNVVKGTIRPYPLSALDKKQSWLFFEKIAFGNVQEDNAKDRSYQILLGTEIIEKCRGNPLVIMAVASMLRSESVEHWFFKNEISKTGESYDRFPSGITYSSDHNETLRLLKLCYDYLPSPLKHCFAYCSLFPKGYEIDVQTLIKLWMSQGFITEQPAEEVGYEYFLILLERYFFQEVERDATKRVTKCNMDNLMHDLAISVAGDQCRLLSSSDVYISSKRTFHVWFGFDLSSTEDIAKFDQKKIRSIFFSGQSRRRYRGMPVNTIFEKITSRFRFLWALDMHASGIEVVPNSIGKLKLLKYLDLSENEEIIELPISITELLNLQTLRLSLCFKLKKLPGDFSNLVNLQHLDIDGCNNLTTLPRGIRKLKNLKALSQFVVSEDSSVPNLVVNKLRKLRELIEKNFEIRNLRLNLRHKKNVPKYLEEVPRGIQILSLEWEGQASEFVNDQTPLISYFSPDVKELSINGFRGATLFHPHFPFPIKMVKLSLIRCANCKTLPSVHQLSSLKVLTLDGMANLEYILEDDSSSTTSFSTLEELWLTELPKLQGWWEKRVKEELPSFHRLSKLVIQDCPKLASMPLFPTLEEGLVLDRTSWKLFETTMNLIIAAEEEPLPSIFPPSPTAEEEPASLTSPPPSIPLSNFQNLTGGQEASSSSTSPPPPTAEEAPSSSTSAPPPTAKESPLSSTSPSPPTAEEAPSSSIPAPPPTAEEAPSSSTSPPPSTPLSKLKNLSIVGINDCEADKIKWTNLKNLQFLRFDCLPKLENLPDGLKEVTSLLELHVWRCDIKEIPDWIGELQKLKKLVIRICPHLKELPEKICSLPALQTLEIEDCNTLLRRCEENIGADWSKIDKIRKEKLGTISEARHNDFTFFPISKLRLIAAEDQRDIFNKN